MHVLTIFQFFSWIEKLDMPRAPLDRGVTVPGIRISSCFFAPTEPLSGIAGAVETTSGKEVDGGCLWTSILWHRMVLTCRDLCISAFMFGLAFGYYDWTWLNMDWNFELAQHWLCHTWIHAFCQSCSCFQCSGNRHLITNHFGGLWLTSEPGPIILLTISHSSLHRISSYFIIFSHHWELRSGNSSWTCKRLLTWLLLSERPRRKKLPRLGLAQHLWRGMFWPNIFVCLKSYVYSMHLCQGSGRSKGKRIASSFASHCRKK